MSKFEILFGTGFIVPEIQRFDEEENFVAYATFYGTETPGRTKYPELLLPLSPNLVIWLRTAALASSGMTSNPLANVSTLVRSVACYADISQRNFTPLAIISPAYGTQHLTLRIPCFSLDPTT